MIKLCAICDHPIMSGENIYFLGESEYKATSSPMSFGLSSDMTVHELYHQDCWLYKNGPMDEEEDN